jgi:hypothetical protein
VSPQGVPDIGRVERRLRARGDLQLALNEVFGAVGGANLAGDGNQDGGRRGRWAGRIR